MRGVGVVRRLCGSAKPAVPRSRVGISTVEELRKKEVIEQMVRGNHACEVLADAMQKGAQVVTIRTCQGYPSPRVTEMENTLIDYRARPSATVNAFIPVAFAFGAITNMIGGHISTVCNNAVAQAAVLHYNSQIRELNDEEINDPELRSKILQRRDEAEAKHFETNVEKSEVTQHLTTAVGAAFSIVKFVAERF
eukprot:c7597_g1_i1.p1 GENE.c7597_g1_i1~~c7597_g1_i1.p1  ORF type:complete len:194 (-),score=47.45 c7597_g1_i1:87-668(-)